MVTSKNSFLLNTNFTNNTNNCLQPNKFVLQAKRELNGF